MATKTAPQKLGYSLREAAELTPFGYDRLRAFIDDGQLKARRAENEDGKPAGKFIVLHDDLKAFLESLPAV